MGAGFLLPVLEATCDTKQTALLDPHTKRARVECVRSRQSLLVPPGAVPEALYSPPLCLCVFVRARLERIYPGGVQGDDSEGVGVREQARTEPPVLGESACEKTLQV